MIANKFIGFEYRTCETLRIISNKNYKLRGKIDCIGLIAIVFRNFGIVGFEKFILAEFYKNITKKILYKILTEFLMLNSGALDISFEISSGDILVFLVNGNKVHFAIAEVIFDIVYIIHANSDVRKVTKEILGYNLKKDLINIFTLNRNIKKIFYERKNNAQSAQI